MRAYDADWISLADSISNRSSSKQQLGAVLVKNKDIISKGYNRSISLYKVLTRYGLLYSIHAEMDALRKLPFGEAEGATLYVSRSGLRTAKPCDACLTIMKKAGIKRVVFSVNTGMIDSFKL